MKNWKKLLLATALLTCLVIVAVVVWLFKLNGTIQEGLKTKQFLPPTEYYSAPETLFPGQMLSRSDLERRLLQRGYRPRQSDQTLFPGDYVFLPLEKCQETFPESTGSSDRTECLVFITKTSPDPELKDLQQALTLSSDGKILEIFRGSPLQQASLAQFEPDLVAQFLNEQPIMQTYKQLGEIPTQCLNAVLAIEDANFLEHGGVSITGLARAALKVVSTGRASQGGSTITQQLVKNYFLTAEKTIKRKAIEFAMSLLLEAHSSKDEIFETYLNIIYLGQSGPFQIRGFGAASEYYFQKPIEQLQLPECALLAAVLNSPGLFDPFRKQENALKRRSLVLDRMVTTQRITPEEAVAAKEVPLPFEKKIKVVETAPYYIDAVNRELKSLGIQPDGLKVFTGLSLKAQEAAQEAVRSQLDRLERDNKKIKELKEKGMNLEGVLVSANNQTGLMNAIVGGRSYRLTQFNRAIDGHRQIGSIMKPFVFLTALLRSGENGRIYNPSTILKDEKFTYRFDRQNWSPENYGKKYYGEVPMYFALKNSLNASTAALGLEVGLGSIIDVAHSIGVQSDLKEFPALTLGAFELYPSEVLESYVTLARLGHRISLSSLRAAVDRSGNILHQFQPISEEVVDKKSTASLVSMMKQTVISGTAAAVPALGFTAPAAGKTGTTSDNKDAWFAGFTPYITAVVWVGYDQPTANGLTGASGAVPLWTQFMKAFGSQFPADDFPVMEGTTLQHVEFTDPEKGLQGADLVFSE